MQKKMSLLGLISITIAFFGSVRAIPMIAATGWTQIFYLLFVGLFFALPIALVAAELSTMHGAESGPQVWVTQAFGERAGFLVAWTQWLMTIIILTSVSMSFSVMLGDMLDSDVLMHDQTVIFFVVLGLVWLLTALNLRFDMLRISGQYVSIIGVYIPFVALSVLGIAFFLQKGVNPEGHLAGFTPDKLLPNFSQTGTLPMFVTFIFVFSGVEMSSVHVNHIDHPEKKYPIAVLSALVFVILLDLIAGLGMANALPEGQGSLMNLMDVMEYYLAALGLPHIVLNILSAFVLVGMFVGINAWMTGPSKSMLQTARQGNMPPFFQRETAIGTPVGLVLVQAAFTSLLAVVLLLPVNANAIFMVITVASSLMYCVVYVFILFAALRLRHTKPDAPRVFRLGRRGNGLMYAACASALALIAAAFVLGMIPPDGLAVSGGAYIAILLGLIVVVLGSGMLLFSRRKPQWRAK